MYKSLLIRLLAIVGMLLAVFSVVRPPKPVPVPPPYAEPARAPFASFVGGAGMIEASRRNIGGGPPVGGIIESVHVKVGDKVAAGAGRAKRIFSKDGNAPIGKIQGSIS